MRSGWFIGSEDRVVSSPPEKKLFLDPIEKHPPERRERKKRYLVLYSCCCCCCCLHTIGGAIGAACGGNFRAESDPTGALVKRPPSSQLLYWTSFLLAVPVGMVLWAFISGEMAQAPIAIGLSIILTGPAWLLAASVVMAIRLALRSDLPSKSEYWRQLRRITLGAVVGSVVGTLVMIPIFLLLAL